MSKHLMAIQGILVVGILSLILVIYYGKQDHELSEYQSNLESATIKYMSDHNMKATFQNPEIVFTSDLLENEYIKEIKEKYCIESIIVSKDLFRNKYKFNKTCE